MKDNVVSKIGNVLDEYLKEFFSIVETEYSLPKDILWKKWKEDEKFVKKDNNHNNKKSEYQVFFSIQRNKMVKENPNITFGEISKQVSILWKKLNPQEKLQYATTPLDNAQTLDNLRKDYMKRSIQDLKNICKTKGIISKLRKKEDMVNSLIGWEETQQNGQLSIQQEISKGRSKLELSIEDKEEEEEEEDFYFNDEEEIGCSNEVICDDDDETEMATSDEDDIFEEDD